MSKSSLARSVAAEDLRRGDIVAILDEIYELPSFLWSCDTHLLPPQEPVRMKWRTTDNGRPLKVKAICLPFLLVKAPCGKAETLDVRKCQLVRLNRNYAKRVWKKLRKRDQTGTSLDEGGA